MYRHVQNTEDYISAIILYVLPQFEGLPEQKDIIGFVNDIADHEFVREQDHERLVRFASDFFEIHPDRIIDRAIG